MTRPGIFDPWRQSKEAAPPPKTRPLENPVRVRFEGLRVGLFVTVKESPESEVAKHKLVSLFHDLGNSAEAVDSFRQNNVHLSPVEHPRTVTYSAGNRLVVVSVEHEDARTHKHAVDGLFQALRSIRDPALQKKISEAGITTFLK